MPTAAGIRAGRAYVELSAQSKKLKDGLAKAEKACEEFASGVQRRLASALVVAAPAVAVTKLFADFDDQMRIVQAVSGATGDEFDKLTEKAKELGRTTSFTASQVASGMAGLGRAGFKSGEINDAIASVMALSKATATDLPVATDIAANALRAFNLDASSMGRVCDVLTATANGSAQTVEDLGEALKYVAPIAAQTGMSLEDTAKILGSLANFGIKGSNAGTAFKNMRTRMADANVQQVYKSIGVDTVEKDTGALRNLSDVLKDVGKAVADMPDAQKLKIFQDLFGMYGLAGGAVLSTAEDFEALFNAIDNASGTAEKTADSMEAGLGGSLRSAASAVEGLAIAVGEALQPTIIEITETVKEWTAKLTQWTGANATLLGQLLKLGAGVAKSGVALLIGAKAVSLFVSKVKTVHTVISTTFSVLSKLTGATKAYSAATTAATAVANAQKAVKTSLLAVSAAQTASEVAAAQAEHVLAVAELEAATAAQTQAAATAVLAGALTVVAAVAAAAVAAMAYFAISAQKATEKAAGYARAAEQQAQANDDLRSKDKELFEELEELASRTNLTNEEFQRGKTIIEQLTSRYGDLGFSVDEASKSIKEAAGAQDAFNEAQRKAKIRDLQSQIITMQNANKAIDKEIRMYMGQEKGSWFATAGRVIGSKLGFADSAEGRVETLNDERQANSLKLQSLQEQLDLLTAESKGADEDKKTPELDVSDRAAKEIAAKFENARAEERGAVSSFDKERGELEKQFSEYVDAQKTILDAAIKRATPDDGFADQKAIDAAQKAYQENVASAKAWFDKAVAPIDAQKERADRESGRTERLAEAQNNVLDARLKLDAAKETGVGVEDAQKAVEEAEKALDDLKTELSKERAQDATERLTSAIQGLKDAQASGNTAQIEAAQAELKDAQAEAANANNELADALADAPKEIVSSGTFDAFEAFDMTNDWERQAMEKQTETLEDIKDVIEDIRNVQKDEQRDENGVVNN